MKNSTKKRLKKHPLILFILSLALFTVALFALFSCKPSSFDDENKQSATDQSGNKDDNITDTNPDKTEENGTYIWAEGVKLYIVVPSSSPNTVKNAQETLFNEIGFTTGTPCYLANDSSQKQKNEIVIGNTTREISLTAYTKLEELRTSDQEDAWLIYTEDTSIAIAYTSITALGFALDNFIDSYCAIPKLSFEASGILKSSCYNLRDYAYSQNQAKREEAFSALEKTVSKEIVDELRLLYTLYTPEVYIWIARLYDSDIGGFYFSNSGRDNEGFLPDIESTVQALHHLSSGGLFSSNGGYPAALPKEMRKALLNFAKGLQSSVDGYFYHPQWGNEIITARRGRDLGWATSLIKEMGGRPYYNTPNNVSGELGAPGASAKSALTERLISSNVTAVSKVVSTASTLPKYLQSLDAWAEYIDGLYIDIDPYTSGNTLSAQHGEIAAAGEEYIDYLTNYLDEHQDPETGFWGEGVSYLTMNGFMKLSHCYTYYGKAVPNVEAALYSTIEILLTPDTEERDLHVCNTYNTWVNFTQILSSAKKTEGAGKVSKLRSVLLEKAPELIHITYEKISTHLREEGGFSYFEKATCNASQKAPVACATSPESDVNATCICTTGITTNIFGALGIKSVPLYYSEDYDYFIRILETKEPIVKNEGAKIEFPELLGDRGNGKNYENSIKYGAQNAPSSNSTSSKIALSNTENKYLYFYKNVKENEENAQSSINYSLPASAPEGASGIEFELDIAFGGFTNYTNELIKVSGFQITIQDGEEYASVYFDGGSGKIKTQFSTVIDGENIALDENRWYNLRFETYEYGESRAIKIYVDGAYACIVTSADDRTTTTKKVSVALRQFETDDWVAIDNVYAGYAS